MKDRSIARRIFIFGLAATLAWGAVIIRLFILQAVHGSQFQEQAKTQYQRAIETYAPRGEILDRNFNQLAVDLAYCAFGAHTRQVEEIRHTAEVFAKYTNQSKRVILKKLRSKKSFIWLDRKVDLAEGEKIAEEKLKGISRLIQYRRYYPFGSCAGQIVGFTNVDNVGLTGIELQFDEMLAGKHGKMILKADAMGRHFPDLNYIVEKPQKGNSVVLTINLIYQTILQEELCSAVEKSRATAGMGILMNPKTGEILAMSSMPDFNPNESGKQEANRQKNRTITDTFEPGSTFKLVTAAAALEEGIKKPTDKVFCENGRYSVYNHVFRDAHPYGTLTFQEVIEKSSNIGTMKIAKELGRNKLFKYTRDFGFGTETGLRFIGEVGGTLRQPKEWSGLSLYAISIGQEVAVTALQLINAYAAIANGGILMRPRLVYAEIDGNGRMLSQSSPQVIRRVVSRETAEILKSFFEGVVLSGTARRAAIPGMRVAGKTGTAQRTSQGKRGYEASQYTASFVGFCPADNPQIVGLIVIENPHGAYYGGVVAAPALKNTFQRIFSLPHHPSQLVDLTEYPDKMSSWEFRRLPDVRGCWKDVAQERLKPLNFKLLFTGNGGFISGQIPSPGSEIQEGQNVILTLSHGEPAFTGENIVPDIRGASVRKAINLLSRNQIRVEVQGHGQVINQSLPPGTIAPVGALCVLKCRPQAS